ncbi:cytochrome P450 [Annulohypoxylon maeteangense]|uniref:cytochrome P450 n=1 Tax=Annulohypoxylon maeteangense TaxID=1927788 RepID=UPI002007E492|nr:cytochrome P450 [Annulohypoxylon maeteangense]KAI0882848.1 cytochrome P450 [Annulohypoxylon maeteangense]
MGIFDISPLVALYAFGAAITLGLFVFSYRLTLHPLRDYPGPFVARFSDGYGGYHAIKKRLHLATYYDHLKYGSVVRQAPNRLVFNTATALRDIYLNTGINKADVYKLTQFNPQKNIFGTLDRERHRQKRKVYGQVLSDRSLRIFDPIMSKEIDVFLRLLLRTSSETMNMTPLCERLTTDVAGQLAFGQPLNTLTAAKNRIFPRAMISMNGLVNIFMAWPAVSNTWPIIRRLNRKNGESFSGTLRGIIQGRTALAKDAKHDFYSIVTTDDNLEGEGLRHSELWAEASFILPAGATTLSAALSALFFYLSRHPTVYARLAAEIRTTFANNIIQNGPQLSGCKYLRAVIDETMRMSPPFVGTFWREPHASYTEPFVVDGHVIPRGIAVGVNPYCVMHNEAYFPEPFAFRPERWLGPEDGAVEEDQARATMRAAFAPFALGDTGCLGKAMAYNEMSLVIAKTLWYFDFEKAPGEAGKLGEGVPGNMDGRHRVDEYQLLDLAVADHDGPNLVFKPRGEYWKALIDDEE